MGLSGDDISNELSLHDSYSKTDFLLVSFPGCKRIHAVYVFPKFI